MLLPGRTSRWNGPWLTISRVILPANPAWIVGAVMCAVIPNRACLLRPSTRAASLLAVGRRTLSHRLGGLWQHEKRKSFLPLKHFDAQQPVRGPPPLGGAGLNDYFVLVGQQPDGDFLFRTL